VTERAFALAVDARRERRTRIVMRDDAELVSVESRERDALACLPGPIGAQGEVVVSHSDIHLLSRYRSGMTLIAFPAERMQRQSDELACECGSTWFRLERTSPHGDVVAGAVNITRDGRIVGYAGDLVCNDCDNHQ